MRPTLAIIPLALLLSWFGPTPSGELGRDASLSLNEASPQGPTEPDFVDQVAQAWDSLQRGEMMQATSDLPQRR